MSTLITFPCLTEVTVLPVLSGRYLCLSGFYDSLQYVLDVGGKSACVLAARSLLSAYVRVNAPVHGNSGGDKNLPVMAVLVTVLCARHEKVHTCFFSFLLFILKLLFDVRVCFDAQKRARWMLCECIFTKIPSNS